MSTKQLIVFLIVSTFFLSFCGGEFSNLNINSNNNNGPLNNEELDNLKASTNPGSFILSSDEQEVEEDESFKLSWTASEGADNYSVYVSREEITEISAETYLVKENLTTLEYTVNKIKYETSYYSVAAFNESGYTLSNNIKTEEVSDSAKDDDDALYEQIELFAYFIPVFIVFIAIFFGGLSYFIVKSRQDNRFKPLTDYSKQPASSISNARKEHESYKSSKRKIISTEALIDKNYDNSSLAELIEQVQPPKDTKSLRKYELTSLATQTLAKIDKIPWNDEAEKFAFIQELLALTPEERDEILEYMLEKSKIGNKS